MTSKIVRLVACLACLAAGVLAVGAQDRGGSRPLVVALQIEGPIGPPLADYIAREIDDANERGADLILIEMDTPGGLVTSMRKINKAILGSRAPVASYVTPAGARAASAGAYILYASHIAAMAPGTNVGAATPVQMGGGGLPFDLGPQDEGEGEGDGDPAAPDNSAPDNAMEAKSVNDAVASIRSLAELRGRNADIAEAMVRQAVSLSARDALEQNVVDVLVENRNALFAAVDGRTVETANGLVSIRTDGAAVERVEPGWIDRLLGTITHPNVAFLLMGIGFYGIIIEFWNPGSILPGVVGAISLVLGLYALSVLSVNYAALALLILGAALAAAEAFTPTFGALAAAGMAAFLLGGLMLFPEGSGQLGFSRSIIVGTAATFAALLGMSLWVVVRGHRRHVTTGAEGMEDAPARVLSWTGESGWVMIHGERWRAQGPRGLHPDDDVLVDSIEGLTARVRPSER